MHFIDFVLSYDNLGGRLDSSDEKKLRLNLKKEYGGRLCLSFHIHGHEKCI